jgi:serine/threonine-protein kinase HipA
VKHQDLLEVDAFVYGMKIGTMIMYHNRIYFEYDKAFITQGIEISPMKLNTKHIDIPYTNKDSFEIYRGMPGVFFDSLPDKHGMPFIYRYFEQKGFSVNDVTLLHKLTFIADRGLGAIEYKPKEHQKNGQIEDIVSAKNLHEDMRKVLEKDQDSYSIDMLMNIIDSASPVGGARPKMLISYNKDTKQIKYNNPILDNGYSRAIIKFDEVYPDEHLIDKSIDLTKLEYLYMCMAKECGIDTAKVYIHQDGEQNHLVLERFDRDDQDNKFHVCSASGLMHKDISVANVMSYEELFAFTNKICHKQSDVKELYRRMIFNALSFNVDDHAKNFEFIMSRDGEWKLSPAFDITYSKGLVRTHITSINGKNENFVIDDFLSIARKNLISEKEALEIIETVSKKLLEFEQRARKLNIDENTIQECKENIKQQRSLLF